MTYRYVTQPALKFAQLATLVFTAVLGFAVLLTPPQHDPKLAVIEETMSYYIWGYCIVGFALVGITTELWMWFDHKRLDALAYVVAICHMLCCGVTSGLAVAALVGVLRSNTPYNFGSSSLIMLLACWHGVFAKRKPHA